MQESGIFHLEIQILANTAQGVPHTVTIFLMRSTSMKIFKPEITAQMITLHHSAPFFNFLHIITMFRIIYVINIQTGNSLG